MGLSKNEEIVRQEKLINSELKCKLESTNYKDTSNKLNARTYYGPNETVRIFKNLIALSVSFVLLFTSFSAVANLQSSLNEEGGLGVYSMATIYLGLSLSSLFLPSIVIRKFSCKWTIVFSMIGYMIYIAAQFYPTFATLIPAGLIVGICAAPLWSANSIYVTKIGEEYGYLTSTPVEIVLQRFFGMFFLFFQTCQVWGNLISSLLLPSADHHLGDNSTAELDFTACGVNYCPIVVVAEPDLIIGDVSPILSMSQKRPDVNMIYWLSGIFFGISILGAIVTWLFVDSLERYGEYEDSTDQNLSAKQLVLATIRLWKNPHQVLLIPLSIWVGIQSGFIVGDFNLGYVTCVLGVKYIGYAMISFGVTDALSSFIFGRLIKHTGRVPVFIFAGGINVTSFVILFTWTPTPENPEILLLLAGLWGIADGIWIPQVTALYGTVFPRAKEAAFSNSRFWSSVGYITVFVNGTQFCMETKLYFCIVFLMISLVGYLMVEVKLRLVKGKSHL